MKPAVGEIVDCRRRHFGLRQRIAASNLSRNLALRKPLAGTRPASSARPTMQQKNLESPHPIVIVLKKVQGGVWREAGRTGLCPTARWIARQFGVGEYELRLKSGPRVLCIATLSAERAQAALT
jgi:hypothetical protein